MKNDTKFNIPALLASKAGHGATALRIPVGIILAAHGAQKLFGWFGGYGLEGTGQWLASVGFEPGYLMALLAGSAEFLGGIALVLGLLTRPAAILAAFTMTAAMTVHMGNGLFLSNNGYEYALALLSMTVSLAFLGGGNYSLDGYLADTIRRGSRDRAPLATTAT